MTVQRHFQVHSDPRREADPNAVPNIEVWDSPGEVSDDGESGPGWYWWACFPGCLPDGEMSGPFDTKAEAIADAQDCE